MTLLIDAMSLQYRSAPKSTTKDDLEGSQFVIRNPNTSTTCGCRFELLGLISNSLPPLESGWRLINALGKARPIPEATRPVTSGTLPVCRFK